MNIASLLKQVRLNGIDVKLYEENLELIFPQADFDRSIIDLVKENKEAIVSYLKSITSEGTSIKILQAPKKEFYPITSSQLRFWILCQMEDVNRAYNLPLVLKLEGKLDVNILRLAFNALVRRHEILRTHFVSQENGVVVQKILEDFDFNIEIKNSKDDGDIADTIAGFMKVPFVLSESVLFKTLLINKDESEHYLCINLHHIISDGSSLEILLIDLTQIYTSLCVKNPISLPALTIQFKDYAEWVSNKENIIKEEKYWLDTFSGELPVINLPTFQPRPPVKSYNGSSHRHIISQENFEKIRTFSSENKGTLFMSLMAALNGLLYRYTGQTDIILGTPVSNRNKVELQNQIGLYINTLPIRMRFHEGISFYQLFNQQKQALESAYSHVNYAFGDLVSNLSLSRDASRSPLFDILVTHQQKNNDTFNFESGFANLKCSLCPNFDNSVTKYDLTFTFFEDESNITIYIDYNTDLFQTNFIEDLAINYENFITQSIRKPDLSIGETPFLDIKQLDKLLNTFNATDLEYDAHQTIISAFKRQVAKSPNDIALICDGAEMTYKELDEKTTQLAVYLHKQGVIPNTTVGVCMARSLEMVVAIFGILKSGASYLPLDPFYPLDRIDYIIKDSNTEIVLTDDQTKSILPTSVKVVIVDTAQVVHQGGIELSEVESTSMAYVIYTSGSTGKPKGVKISHRNLVNFIEGMNQKFAKTDRQDVWLAMTSISFDISILELMWTLVRGDKVVIHLERPVPVLPKAEMDFSLFYFPTGTTSGNNKYKLLIEGASYADRNGFKAIWVPERHFHKFGDQFPNPSVAAAAVSTITKSIRLRSGSVVLPLHDPVRVAEEWSMIDNLSGGRVELSIASGWHPNDFVLAPNDYPNRHQLMREKIETLKKLWKGDTLTRKNGVGKDFEFGIHPTPMQNEVPLWITAAGSEDTFRYAGTIGANVLTHLLGQSFEDLEGKIKIYRHALQENGFDPQKGKVALMLHTYVGEDTATIKKIVEGPFKEYLRNSLNLLKPIAEEQGLDLDDNNNIDALLDMGFLRFYGTSSLFGTPEACLEIINKAYSVSVNEIACLIDFGVEEQKVIESFEHLFRLKELVRRSKVQYDFVAGRMKKLTTVEDTATLVHRYRVTHVQSTPSFYEEFLLDANGKEALRQVKTLLVGGEALKKSLADKLICEVGRSIYNMYGPTETTIWSSMKEVKTSDDVTIGRPIANTKIYILDAHNHLCPVGVSGELCIGGDGVSLGYVNNDELTKTKFIENPFAPDQKIYKTGDLACWLPNGELEHQGRMDTQIKINGYRIELKEIENVILEHEAVVQCTVSTFEENERVLLAAYIKTLRGNEEEDAVKEFLRLRLPHYMIPQHVISLHEFPKTPNGKIDVKKLPPPKGGAIQAKNYAAPRNEMEERLAILWSEFLKTERISIHDNFFEIGGNSMKAFQLLPVINTALNSDLKIIAFFQYPTIGMLAEHLTQNNSSHKVRIEENEMEDVGDVIDFMSNV